MCLMSDWPSHSRSRRCVMAGVSQEIRPEGGEAVAVGTTPHYGVVGSGGVLPARVSASHCFQTGVL